MTGNGFIWACVILVAIWLIVMEWAGNEYEKWWDETPGPKY